MVKNNFITDTYDDINNKFQQNGLQQPYSSSTQRIISSEDEEMEIIGFELNKIKNHVTWICYIFSLGLLRLFFHWYPQLHLFATHTECSLSKAEKVLIIDTYKSKFKTYFVKKLETKSYSQFNSKETILNSIKLNTNCRTSISKYSENLTVSLENGKTLVSPTLRSFKCKKNVFVWCPQEKLFLKMVGFEFGKCNSDFHSHTGLSKGEQDLKKIIYGANEINIPVQSILTLLVLEALTPFYIFQVFSVLLWIAELYFYYGAAIVIMSVYGISSSIIQTRTNQKNLKGTVFSEDCVTVCRGKELYEEIKTSDLVPGDLISIPSEGCNMQCDAILIKGNCIVNESMLTGESVPVHKTALPNNNNYYRSKEDSNHTLFCGTTILQTKFCGGNERLAVVIRTGYLTTKGELVRSILYPPPADFKFDQDSYKFIGILSIIAILGFVYTIAIKSTRKFPFWDTAIKALDLVTIAIPPALPAAMTVGKLYALGRLKRNKIFCINSRVINVSGSIDCVCFDKTGTLTEDELDMWGVLPVDNGIFDDPIKYPNTLTTNNSIFKGMLTCHSLSIIDGKLCGYPLDIKMFNSTSWCYREVNEEDLFGKQIKPLAVVYSDQNLQDELTPDIEIYMQFPFISALQRSSVICKDITEGSIFEVYCKGSPEMIVSLSTPDSVPEDVFRKLQIFTSKGYRVIATAARILDVDEKQLSEVTREDIEKDLIFSGLIILENKLKIQTPDTIKILKNAGLKVAMITGDNIQTAVSVAKECGIVEKDCSIFEVMATNTPKEGPKIKCNSFDVDTYSSNDSLTDYYQKNHDPEIVSNRHQLVLTGKTWSNVCEHFPHYVSHIANKGVVFSRMSARQKQQLIEELKNNGYYVAMCGDGANDCAALKAAHLGISLSEAEASIAAPFTSKESNISCVPMIIREGRAALLTSFGVFKFMVCGSLAEFFCVIILYGIDCNLSSMQFLFIDIFLQLNLASFFGNTEACDKLYHKPPLTSLLSFTPLISMVLLLLQTAVFQVIAFYYIRSFSFYESFKFIPHVTSPSMCQENYSTFVIAMFQYIKMAVLFSKGEPYRKALYTNKKFMFLTVLTTLMCVYVTLYPAAWLVQILEMKIPPDFNGRWQLLTIVLSNFVVAFFVEELLIDVILDKQIYPLFKKCKSESTNSNSDSDIVIDFNDKGTVLNKINEVKKTRMFHVEEASVVTRC